MIVSVSLVLILFVVILLLWRYAGLRLWHAVLCVLFGFYLENTGLAPYVRRAVAELSTWVGGLG